MLEASSVEKMNTQDCTADWFDSGHFIVGANRHIQYSNNYLADYFGWSKDALATKNLSELFSKASNIFIDSYVYPLLINQNHVEEIQLTFLTSKGEKIPIVANVKLGDGQATYWSIFGCVNRNKLYQELIQAKELLETQSQKLMELATIDPLTGLLNRRELDAQVKRILLRSQRTQASVAVMIIDIDFFKGINDTHGHAFGDDVLCQLSALLLKNRRKYDITARIGGEEFVIVLPDINAINAQQIAETLRKDIESTEINGIHVTVSIGVTTNKHSENDFATLYKEADKALYSAKQQGRNRIILN